MASTDPIEIGDYVEINIPTRNVPIVGYVYYVSTDKIKTFDVTTTFDIYELKLEDDKWTYDARILPIRFIQSDEYNNSWIYMYVISLEDKASYEDPDITMDVKQMSSRGFPNMNDVIQYIISIIENLDVDEYLYKHDESEPVLTLLATDRLITERLNDRIKNHSTLIESKLRENLEFVFPDNWHENPPDDELTKIKIKIDIIPVRFGTSIKGSRKR